MKKKLLVVILALLNILALGVVWYLVNIILEESNSYWIYVNILDTKKLSLNSMPVLRKMGWAKALDMEPPRA